MPAKSSDYQSLDINIAGSSYPDRSRPLSSQSSINLYPQIAEQGKAKFVLKPFPGQKAFGSTTAAVDRGIHVMDEVLFRVLGSTLYEVDSNGVHTNRGTILGNGYCTFADNSTQLAIVNNGNVQVWDSTAVTLTTVTDADIVGSESVTFLNSQYIYTKDQLFIISNVNDPTTASGLNSANAESQPDDLIRAYAFQETVTMFGCRSTESWYNSGTGSPPFARIDGQSSTIGLAALNSVANTEEFLYWLGHDRSIYVTRGQSIEKISNSAISSKIESYSRVDDAIGMTCTLDGENFYILTFPSENKTWALNESLGNKGWFELSADLVGGKINFTSLINCYGKNLVADETSGELNELDFNTNSILGATYQRQRTTGTIDGNLLGARGNRMLMSRMEFFIENGVGLISGQGENPQLIIERSIDGGRSFKEADFVEMGRLGDHTFRVEWWNMESFLSLIIRITLTDPVPCFLYDAVIDVKLAGR